MRRSRQKRKRTPESRSSVGRQTGPLQPKVPLRHKRASWYVPKAVVNVLLGLLGLFGLTYFLPDTMIHSAGALNPETPFSTQFQIANEGKFSIYDVQAQCRATRVDLSSGVSLDELGFTYPDDWRSVLRPGERHTLTCDIWNPQSQGSFAIPGSVQSADLTLVVSYKTWFGWRSTKRQRFVTKPGRDGLIFVEVAGLPDA